MHAMKKYALCAHYMHCESVQTHAHAMIDRDKSTSIIQKAMFCINLSTPCCRRGSTP